MLKATQVIGVLDDDREATPLWSRRPLRRVSSFVNPTSGTASIEAFIDCPPLMVFELLTAYEELSTHIVCLHESEVLRRHQSTASVRYSMRLPFPIGTVSWTNLISARALDGGAYRLDWTLVDGDLSECRGQIHLFPAGEFGAETRALYEIHVQHGTRLPKGAQQMVVRWLMPRVISRLSARLEHRAKQSL